jgi:hypothetical protein
MRARCNDAVVCKLYSNPNMKHTGLGEAACSKRSVVRLGHINRVVPLSTVEPLHCDT